MKGIFIKFKGIFIKFKGTFKKLKEFIRKVIQKVDFSKKGAQSKKGISHFFLLKFHQKRTKIAFLDTLFWNFYFLQSLLKLKLILKLNIFKIKYF